MVCCCCSGFPHGQELLQHIDKSGHTDVSLGHTQLELPWGGPPSQKGAGWSPLPGVPNGSPLFPVLPRGHWGF